MNVHSHSNPPTLFPVDQLSFDFGEGDNFSYSSRACGVVAPFNDLGLNFRPDYPGVDDDADGTAPVRHHVEGMVTKVNGTTGTVEGMITSVLCVTVNGVRVESENSIVTLFKARFRQVSDNQLKITGRFELSPGKSTGTFARIEGGGSIVGPSPAWATSGTLPSRRVRNLGSTPTSSRPEVTSPRARATSSPA